MKTRKKLDGFVVARVQSDSNHKTHYQIRRVAAGLVCPCLAFRFARGPIGSRTKICKHIERMSL
jgi:hypothetical protein